MKDEPPKTPYLRFGEVERPIIGPAVEIVGNARGLLQLRAQIDRALKDQTSYPLDDVLYRDNFEDEYEVVVRKARSRAEMEWAVQRLLFGSLAPVGRLLGYRAEYPYPHHGVPLASPTSEKGRPSATSRMMGVAATLVVAILCVLFSLRRRGRSGG